MINIPEQDLYKIINDNIEYLIDDDITTTYNNIKKVTIGLLLFHQNNFKFINEDSSSSDIINYFKDSHYVVGSLIWSLLVTTDIAIGTITTEAGFASYIITTITNILGPGTVSYLTGSLLSTFGPLLLIIIAFVIYKKINKFQALNVIRMLYNLDRLSKSLKFKMDPKINSEFENLLKNKCNVVNDRNLRLECAINGYSNFLNKFILNKLILRYIEFLKANNEDLSNINSFNELARFKCQSNRSVSNLMNSFYNSYLNFLNGLNINKFVIGDNFSLLNNITKTTLKKVY